jgi:hypothetical protein
MQKSHKICEDHPELTESHISPIIHHIKSKTPIFFSFTSTFLQIWGASKMKCPKCHFENREGVRFCEECGTKFELECPSCKANIPIGRKFCGDCGSTLTLTSEKAPEALSFDEKLEKIQKVPAQRPHRENHISTG